ncbi:MAG TPA: efflux RND transporter periplasmic adaptor subunit [Flavipsychrobacter sp.]|jgi:RND family efflux transporter MFP subunit|nr:efflux RND transporter periplasmic adaptor subunit [Flavipsychrobacter sp.]
MKRSVYLLLATVILASCGGKKTETKTQELIQLKKQRAQLDQKIAKLEQEAASKDTSKATPVSIVTLAPEAFNSYVEVQGVITGEEDVLASPQASGIVKNISVRVGQKVSKGQTLATLDAAAIEQQIQATNAQLSLAKTLYEKQQRLWAQNIGTEVQLLQAKTNYENVLNQKQAQVAQRNMYTIKSPINGVIDAININEGDLAAPGASGFHVVSKDRLKATANLGENYLGKVQQGDPVTLVFPDLNDSMHTKLTYVAQSVNPISRAFTAEVKLGSNNHLHPNMSCIMKIANYTHNNALVVPVSAIQKTAEGSMLFVAEGNKARSIIVQTGKNSNGMVEILGGLSAGDKVITAGQEDLDNGDRIAIK